MSGFDDAFDARVDSQRHAEHDAQNRKADRESRIQRMRDESIRQLAAAGAKAVSKLRNVGLPRANLVADRGPLRRTAPVAEGWPLDHFIVEGEYGGITHHFNWFLLSDGRLTVIIRGPESLDSTWIGPHSKEKLDQLERFNRSFDSMIEDIDIVVEADAPYQFQFGGLTHTGRYATSYSAPTAHLAFDEAAGVLVYASAGAGSAVRCVPVETGLAELVADAVLHPAIQHWR